MKITRISIYRKNLSYASGTFGWGRGNVIASSSSTIVVIDTDGAPILQCNETLIADTSQDWNMDKAIQVARATRMADGKRYSNYALDWASKSTSTCSENLSPCMTANKLLSARRLLEGWRRTRRRTRH